MFRNFNRGISTPILIGIIAVLVVVVVGGILGYRYYSIPQQLPATQSVQKQLPEDDFSKLDKDVLLQKLFPNLSFKDGEADLSSVDYPGLRLYLKDSIEDYFITSQEKNLLLIVELEGVAHAGGLYHAYLGLFNKNGNLLTPSSIFPGDFFEDKAHFGGDLGEFGFYDCEGIKYILFVGSRCAVGSCCDTRAELFRIRNGNFDTVQTINEFFNDPEGPFKMLLSGNKILIKKVPPLFSDNDCPETDYKVLKWNKDSCRFE